MIEVMSLQDLTGDDSGEANQEKGIATSHSEIE
jgi:hypothetical protein